MANKTFKIISIICATTLGVHSCSTPQIVGDYLRNQKDYHYRALYIDETGDTITNEIMVLRTLGEPWETQPRLQTAIQYIYHTDTNGYRRYRYVVPEYNSIEKDSLYAYNGKLEDLKGVMKLHPQVTTGAIMNSNGYYMHPPRSNQYANLFNAPHPSVNFEALCDTTSSFEGGISVPFTFKWAYPYITTPLGKIDIKGLEKVNAWRVEANTMNKEECYLKPLYEKRGTFRSCFNGTYTKEYGFIKMHYVFENNIKILFDLEDVFEL